MNPIIEQIFDFLTMYVGEGIAKFLAPVSVFAAAVLLYFMVLMLLRRFGVIAKETKDFYAFIAPWLFGFIIFTLGTMSYSLYISFFEWDLIGEKVFIGLDNYQQAFFNDKIFYGSLGVTFYYAIISIPLQLVLGFLVAMLMNQKVKGIAIFRTIYYLPTLVAGVAVSVLWMWIFNGNFGLINRFLLLFGISGPDWLNNEQTVMPALVIMSLWGIGGSMIIYLAGLQDIPRSLYEAAEIDGATTFHKFKNITIPMMTPILFFNLIMGIIGSLQTFTQAYVMTEGGPNGASMFFVLHIYKNAFEYFNMGYAAALSWILFFIILAITLLVLKSSSLWVFYESELMKDKKRKKVKKDA
ncbi:carbohydrate ABC transporter permease [Vallitalea pronyensis]|nr:sugar ABC transporter permease [Vallitalea pronyensis]